MMEAFKKLPILWRIVVMSVLGLLIIWGTITITGKLSSGFAVWNDNRKDAQLAQKDKEIEAIKEQNKKEIELYKADNIKLKAERDAQDKVILTIKAAISNDGKIVESEQKNIDEAKKKYEETKDSCATIGDTDAYVQCVCAKLGVACN